MKHANRSASLAAGLLVLVASASAAAPNKVYTDEFGLESCTLQTTGANPWFPLTPGSVLRLEGEDGREGFTVLQLTVTEETREVHGVATRVVLEEERTDGRLLEVSQVLYASCAETGAVFLLGEDVASYEDGALVSTEGGWRAGENGARAGLAMPGTLLLGSRYVQELAPGISVDHAEIVGVGLRIETPAGTFENCVHVLESSTLERGRKTSKYYAPGLGLIVEEGLELVDASGAP